MMHHSDELLSDRILVEDLCRLSPEELIQRNAEARAAAANVIAALRHKLAGLQHASDDLARRAGVETADRDAATTGEAQERAR